MEQQYTQMLVDLGISLTTMAVKGTATAVNTKIRGLKNEKNVEKIRGNYDEIVNELLIEREEAVRIAQAYKSELDKVIISDNDIEHLHTTLSKALEIIKNMQMLSAKMKGEDALEQANATASSYDQFLNLISVDTLKTMQLLGFNYKAAIGEPLTEMCANAISSLGKKKETSSMTQRKK